MEFSVKSGSPEKQRTACVVVGVYEPRRLTPSAQRIDDLTNGYISSLIRRGDLEGKSGQTLLLHNISNTLCDRILLVGCGRERDLSFTQYRKIISNAVSTLNDTGSMEAVFYLTELPVKGCDSSQRIRHAVEAAQNSLYRFDQLKSKKDTTRRPLRKIVLTVPNRRDLADGELAVREGMAITQGIKLAKDLGNMPGNICTPSYLADRAKTLTRVYSNLSVDILDEAQLEEMGMNAFLSVSRGSHQPAKMIVLNFTNADSSTAPICLVGKGVTFDSGGISLKPGTGMDEMKYDMCGAASVLGAVNAIAELQLEVNVIAVIPATENLPDGLAVKPGDIVTSFSGTTIEILNTDAEGRLVLCDALSYCEKFKPAVVIDVATLTGACVVALGKHAAGLYSNHSPLAHDLNNAGKSTGDRVWEMPLWDEYQEQLKSNFADLANIGGKEAGSVTAAIFLSAFCKKYHWAHLDIAGVAWDSGQKKGATGRPVSLLTQYIIEHAKNI
ncbi:MAG: leucyl aminopeptidase [gamma proteobacterium symbiont of Bathyaustriella thionipta]|nr:leucyl aminopeptidase [gamma proteobacterium symbiont of Bathyaustriella thionipta]MCU7949685.1 leucyl aminopeptidase [gamma proteobacterium symbiont of Bathyaustriella thionipta]MCU7952053.1 leucyl aminopeptidase [gamma proteobacterium symbiont of Bathyaustriella thionipta]MCU7956281.1 leucyl aminopeptidase [gamma proteobacterium symbiont of Bathyaustriella thionipta]MCU7968625.1 leucyl aminopeptidase [gamma proteobacterium symbiont of Bathyaustriella thionipta]